jgi:hypothetical protein
MSYAMPSIPHKIGQANVSLTYRQRPCIRFVSVGVLSYTLFVNLSMVHASTAAQRRTVCTKGSQISNGGGDEHRAVCRPPIRRARA